ncbi:restriction endonuclease subunit S [Nostoc sp. NMS9]|uniref:restriction endonuclease subunit S n=1 Tax=Nostoc sp. NMS9 TaxID=2815393 RepID=UPI0025DA387D|nr:restriction endonuclease subunit S [Nostoc sp. NMS9]MBN3943462.1 restriction endonuclease subunit S [Nostoc sp. NMS9]
MSKKLNKKVPQLRFPEFKDNWESNYLDQIGDLKNGFNADKQAFGSGVEFVNLMDIFGKSEIQKTYLERVEIPEKQLEQYKIQKGDVLFVRSSVKREGVGQSCLVNDHFEDTVYSGFIIRFREKSNTLYHLYKKYCFAESSFRKEILSFATSSANTNINQDSLSQILLFYPSIAEQKKIASFLGAVDRRLTQLRRKQELLQTYKRGVIQKIFSQKIRFKSAIGSPFPDWQKKKLGELGTFLGGGTPSTSQKNYWIGGKIPWISSSDLEEDSIYKISITRFINETAIKESATKRTSIVRRRVGHYG